MDKEIIVQRLRDIGNLKAGDSHPEWLPMVNWAPVMSTLCRDAAELIEELDSRLYDIESAAEDRKFE